ncbi:MAG: acyloxyacyl hydrolase [Bacteroidales bacterium]|nr:acyloxyacyl hydrolase [Bacteroidales bacterium]
MAKMRRSIFLFLFPVLLVVMPAAARESKGGVFSRIEGAAYAAWVWPHAPNMDQLHTGLFPMFHLGLSGTLNGAKPWHHAYNFPDIGITLMFADLGYPEVLGRAFGAFPHILLPLARKGKLSLNFRYGLGVAWLTNHFSEPGNEGNIAISNPLNILMNTSLELGFQLSEFFTIRSGFGMTHFSNGKTRTPNKGLNIPALKFALMYNVKPAPELPQRQYSRQREAPWSIRVFGAGGYTRLYPPGGPAFAEYTLSATLGRPLSQKIMLGAGADVFWGYSDREVLRRLDREPASAAGLLKPGLHVSYEQLFGKTSLIIQQGIYLYAANNEDGKGYNRAGLRHQFSDKWLISLTLKSHLFRADYIEWGFGYRIF